MAQTFDGYDGAAWRQAVALFAYDGTWRTAIGGWAYDGTAWRQGFVPPGHGAIASLVVTPATATVVTFGTQQFTATAYDSMSVGWDVTALAAWAVDVGSGSIDAVGLYTASGATGSETISATYSGFNDSSGITVTP